MYLVYEFGDFKNNYAGNKIVKFNKFYLPLSKWIYSIYSTDFKVKTIGLSGGQGAGKSTIQLS